MPTDLDFILRVLRCMDMADAHDTLWWRTDDEFAPVTFFINCNDTFAWATADCEPVTPENIEELERAFGDVRTVTGNTLWGDILFVARARKMRPRGCVYPKNPALWPLFDACGPERVVGWGNPKPHPKDAHDARRKGEGE